MSRQRDQRLRAEAIQRVLNRSIDRIAIASLGDLRRAYEDELAAHGAEIAAKVDAMQARGRETVARAFTHAFAQRIRCLTCDGPITDAKRISRRYCSTLCRQSAYRRGRRLRSFATQ
jgi:hypothetical protein